MKRDSTTCGPTVINLANYTKMSVGNEPLPQIVVAGERQALRGMPENDNQL